MFVLRERVSLRDGTFRGLSPTRSWCAYRNRAITMFPEVPRLSIETTGLRDLSLVAKTTDKGHTHSCGFSGSFEALGWRFGAKGSPHRGEAHLR